MRSLDAGAEVASMTTILTELRLLDERLSRGDLTRAEYRARRSALLQSVEEAETEFDRRPGSVRSTRQRAGSGAVGFSVAICLGTMSLCMGLILLFLPDLNLALTLGVTVLAALSVALLRALDD